MAKALSLGRVLVPPSAGVFSSYGLLYSEVAYHFTKSRKTLLGAVDPAEIDAILHELEAHTLSRLGEDGFSRDQVELERAAALHYQGQSFELEVPIPVGAMDRTALTAVEEAYGIEHEKIYGHRAGADEPVELITLKVVGRGLPDVPRAALAAAAELPEVVVIAQPLRCAYFGPAHGWCDTDIINRADLGEPKAGPCIIEEYDSTCVVPPGSTANLDPFGNIVIDVRAPYHEPGYLNENSLMRRSTLFAVMLPAFGATLLTALPRSRRRIRCNRMGQANRQTRLELERTDAEARR